MLDELTRIRISRAAEAGARRAKRQRHAKLLTGRHLEILRIQNRKPALRHTRTLSVNELKGVYVRDQGT